MLEAFYFDVGYRERHRIEFSFAHSLGETGNFGRVKIKADGILVENRMFMSLGFYGTFRFTVGQVERHAVVIDKRIPVLFARFRRNTYRVWIDGQLAYIVDEQGIIRPASAPTDS